MHKQDHDNTCPIHRSRHSSWAPSQYLSEIVNAVTHGTGLALSIIGLVVLVVFAAIRGTAIHVVVCAVYGSTLILLYLASTLYHALRPPRAKRVLRIFDHCAIFLLIAGSYTPFALVKMGGAWGWSLFGVAWGFAVLGIVFKILFMGRLDRISVAFYVLMGWMVVVAIKPMVASIPAPAIAWLVAGGVSYTGGVLFYAWEKLPFHHAIWHVAVMAGSVCHYLAVLFYVVPAAP